MPLAAPRLELPRVLGLGAALLAGTPLWIRLWARPEGALGLRCGLGLGALAGFVAAFWLATGLARGERSRLACRALLGLQSLAILALAWAVPGGLLGALLVVVAAQAAEVLPLPAAVALGAVQTLGFGAILAHAGMAGAWTLAAVFALFEGFAMTTAAAAVAERAARQELGRANAELRAAQERLAEHSRAEERLRLSRELHDVMGHHLTALSLNLEAARHAPPELARELVERAHALDRRLLQDVRRVVSALRDDPDLDLARALLELCAGIDQPRVHLRFPDDLRIDDPELARAALRCAQEVVTNTLRHAAAQNLWLVLECGTEGLRIHARDDGRGTAALRPGLGLSGMRERLESLGGRLTVTSSAGQGFEVDALLPLGGGAP